MGLPRKTCLQMLQPLDSWIGMAQELIRHNRGQAVLWTANYVACQLSSCRQLSEMQLQRIQAHRDLTAVFECCRVVRRRRQVVNYNEDAPDTPEHLGGSHPPSTSWMPDALWGSSLAATRHQAQHLQVGCGLMFNVDQAVPDSEG